MTDEKTLTLRELIEWLSGYKNNMDKEVRVSYDNGYGAVGIQKKVLKIKDDYILLKGD